MSVVRQSVMPIIRFMSPRKESNTMVFQTYQEFSTNSKDVSGKNLLSYNFQRSINSFSGNFSISVKEENIYSSYVEQKKPFLDMVKPFDIVTIQEDSDIDENVQFIGVVTNISIPANTTSKVINITGKSIEYLFEFMSISLDVTAMQWADSLVEINEKNLNLKTAVNNGTEAPVILEAIKIIYNSFKNVANQFSKISNAEIIDIFEKQLTENFLEENETVKNKFKYPITSNLYSNSIVTLYSYLKNLFPDKVYEFHGVIEKSKPKIRLREVPFLSVTKHSELLKNAVPISSVSLINYNIAKSIDEVYTVFYSYVEGSAFSPEFYNRLYATTEGNAKSEKNIEKIKKYGYKPLQANFVGFNIEEAENETVIDKLSVQMTELNKSLKRAYENLDEMYKGSITIVNIIGDKKAKIGEFISFSGGKFYVTGEDHSWQYGTSPKITYHVERGGVYNNSGDFIPLKGISQKLVEISHEN